MDAVLSGFMSQAITYKTSISGLLEKLSGACMVGVAFALPLSTTLTDIFFVLAVVCYFVAGNFTFKLTSLLRKPVAWPFVALFALFVVGIGYSTASLHEAVHMAKKYDKLLFAVLLIPVLRDDRWRMNAVYAFLAAMMLTMFFSYCKALGIWQVTTHFGYASVFKSHIQTNFLMAFAAYLLLWLCVRQPDRIWLFLGLFIMATYNILFLSYGRSGYFVFAALFMLFLWQQFRVKGVMAAFAGLLVLVVAAYFVSPVFKNRVDITTTNVMYYRHNKESSMGLRVTFWKNSAALIAKHPVLGTGTGSFATEYASIKPRPELLTTNPHNEYLNIGVQLGLAGILLLLWLFYQPLREAVKLPQPWRHMAQAVVLSIALGCLANSWLMDTTEGHFYALFIALCFSALNQLNETRSK